MKQRSSTRFANSIIFLLVALTSSARSGDDTLPGREGLLDTAWPYGRSDSWRTSAVVGGAGLPKNFATGSLAAKSVEVSSVPFWGVTSSPDLCADAACAEVGDDIFVLGGSPFLMGLFSYATPETINLRQGEHAIDANLLDPAELAAAIAEGDAAQPYIMRIDSKTMQVNGTAILTDGSPERRSVNYTGDLVFHENGKLYAVATSTIFEVDPVSMEVTRTHELPLYEAESDSEPQADLIPYGTVYNSLLVSPDTGDLITKGVNMFKSDVSAKLIDVSTSTPQLDQQFTADMNVAIAAARVTVAKQDGIPFVYAGGAAQTIRYAIGSDGFTEDTDWSATYRTPPDKSDDMSGDGTTGAVGLTFMGDANFVVFPNNSSVGYGVTVPTSLFTQATDVYPSESPIQQYFATSTPYAGGSFYSVAADPYNTGFIVFHDQINGNTAAWKMDENGHLIKQWETTDYATAAGAAIASDQEHLYMGDRRCDGPGLTHCELFLVVLDLTTMEKLGEVQVAGSVPTLGEIFIGDNEVFFISSEADKGAGYVTRISIVPEPLSLLLLLSASLPLVGRARGGGGNFTQKRF
jgi:hypothetical protein